MKTNYRIELEGLLEDVHCHIEEAQEETEHVYEDIKALQNALANARIAMQEIDQVIAKIEADEDEE